MPKKDVASCEKLRGAASGHRSVDIRMGEPGRLKGGHRQMNKIVWTGGTRGTETSKYPEEEKERSILLVAASEEGRGQTDVLRKIGVADHQREAKRESKAEGKRRQRR